MKRTRNSNKQPAAAPKPRKRRTNLELAGFGRDHLKTIRVISEQSRVPIDQVLADVIENGLITVMPMYETMIEFRKSRATKLENLFNRQHNEPTPGEPTGQGGPGLEEEAELVEIEHQSAGAGEGHFNGDERPLESGSNERSDDDVIRSRFAPETDPGFGGAVNDEFTTV